MTEDEPMRLDPARRCLARLRHPLGWLLLALGVAVCPQHSLAANASASNLRNDVVFDRYTPLSESVELARRLLTPLSFQYVQRSLAKREEALRAQPIDLAHEKFAVYVPTGEPPPQGYGLLVFVPPWPTAGLPEGWVGPLNRHGLIYVSAANSGNDANVIDRRIPLALLAYENIRQRFRIDPTRVYVGGLSGGARVALRIALAYPDVFRGVLLNAGSDPIGDLPDVLPPADLFASFQASSRVVYLTGGRDTANLQKDLRSRQSLQDWCVFDVQTDASPWQGHEVANAATFGHALDALGQHQPADAGRLASCRARVDRELSSSLADAEAAIARGDLEGVRKRMDTIDQRYAGLAAAGLLKLQSALQRLQR